MTTRSPLGSRVRHVDLDELALAALQAVLPGDACSVTSACRRRRPRARRSGRGAAWERFTDQGLTRRSTGSAPRAPHLDPHGRPERTRSRITYRASASAWWGRPQRAVGDGRSDRRAHERGRHGARVAERLARGDAAERDRGRSSRGPARWRSSRATNWGATTRRPAAHLARCPSVPGAVGAGGAARAPDAPLAAGVSGGRSGRRTVMPGPGARRSRRPGAVRDAGRPGVGLRHPAHQGEPEPTRHRRSREPVEGLEDGLLVAGRDPAAVVGDLEAPAAPAGGPRSSTCEVVPRAPRRSPAGGAAPARPSRSPAAPSRRAAARRRAAGRAGPRPRSSRRCYERGQLDLAGLHRPRPARAHDGVHLVEHVRDPSQLVGNRSVAGPAGSSLVSSSAASPPPACAARAPSPASGAARGRTRARAGRACGSGSS